MRRLNGTEMKALFVLCAVVSVGLLFPLSTRVAGTETSQSISENPLPLDVYIVSLPDVGNYRATNHSMVVEGALEAAKTESFGVFLDFGVVVHVNVSITVHIVSDWEAYRMLIEWGSNAIAVNTHDEYLPVPSGYTKEEWVDKIADFMLNRWGTWTHLGGYPLYRVWYQNNTREEWGEQGFKRLMSHIGRANATCNPTEGLEIKKATFEGEYLIGWDWWNPYINHTLSIISFERANAGYSLNIDNFTEQALNALYIRRSPYLTGGTIYFSPNQTNFNYGIYVHLSSWRFYDGNGNEFKGLHDLALGFIATAAAIWADIGDATYKIFSTASDTPQDRIKVAKLEGRTVGLDQSEGLLQKAIDAYNMHNYKLSVAYAKQAQMAAENATRPNLVPQIIAGITLAAVTIGVGAYYKIHSNNKRKIS